MNKFDLLIAAQRGDKKPRRRPRQTEHRIQAECVKWFALQYPDLKGRLFAVPNGGRRDATTGRLLKEEGVVAGVADLILLKTNDRLGYGALLIEMKTGSSGSRQQPSQRLWQQTVTQNNEYRYVICRSLQDFIREVNDYLS